MSCEAWRAKLEAYADGELSPPESKALADHFRECPACAAAALEHVQMKRAVAAAGKRYEPGAEFRARIARRVDVKSRRAPSWLWRWVAVPAVLVLILGLAVNVYVGRGKAAQQRLYSEIADLHVATLASPAPVDVISTDRHTVKPWFEGKIPFTFNLPELQNTEFTLIGGRVTYLAQTPGAHLIYRLRKHELSVFIFPERAADSAISTAVPVSALSFNIQSWTQNGLRYFVIGDVGSNDLESLRSLLRNAK